MKADVSLKKEETLTIAIVIRPAKHLATVAWTFTFGKTQLNFT